MLSVLIPVKEPEPWLPKVLKRISMIKVLCPGLIDEVLQERAGSLAEARIQLVGRARSPYVLNLDADSIIPVEYPMQAIDLLLKNIKVGAVALNYKPQPQAHLAFGTSVFPVNVMREFYNWRSIEEDPPCECLHMWRRLQDLGWILATLPLVVRHNPISEHCHIQEKRPKK